jgi:hypothetical protein
MSALKIQENFILLLVVVTPSKGFSVFFKLYWCHVLERSVLSKVIVVVLKCFRDGMYLMHTRKQVRVEDLGAVGAVKALDLAILCRLTRLIILQLDLFVFGPKLHVVACVFRSIVYADAFGLSVEVNKVIQRPRYPRCR